MVKVSVDKEKCIGCGLCISLLPDVFEMDEDGKSRVKMPEINDEDLEKEVRRAAEGCPVEAIIIE